MVILEEMKQAGRIYLKKPGAGFVGEAIWVKYPDPRDWQKHDLGTYEENHEPCWLCNQDCLEWANIEAVNEDGSHRGWLCHVSDCQLEEKQA